MKSCVTISLCAAVAGTAALQIPFLSTHSADQTYIESSHKSKPLVNSTELQDAISGDRLFARAKKLYEIAKSGEHEYNHPTRVIGSEGTSHVRPMNGQANKPQDTLGL